MTATVLVIGGTGRLGAPVVRRLREDGHRVRLLVRDRGRVRNPDPELEYVTGDLDDPTTLQRALAGCAAVHVSVRGGPTAEQYERVEHHGTARVAQLAAQVRMARLTYVSHTLAAPMPSPRTCAPSSTPSRPSPPAACRTRSSGPHTSWKPCPSRYAAAGPSCSAGSATPYHLIAASDFARMVSAALAKPESAGRRLDVHGPQALTIPEALEFYCQRLAPGTKVVNAPLWLMTILDRTVLRGQLRGTLGLMRALQQTGERGDPTEANRLLGAPSTTLAGWCQRLGGGR